MTREEMRERAENLIHPFDGKMRVLSTPDELVAIVRDWLTQDEWIAALEAAKNRMIDRLAERAQQSEEQLATIRLLRSGAEFFVSEIERLTAALKERE